MGSWCCLPTSMAIFTFTALTENDNKEEDKTEQIKLLGSEEEEKRKMVKKLFGLWRD